MYIIKLMILNVVDYNYVATGTDKPTLKLLNDYVRETVSPQWYYLGQALLEQNKLNVIKANHPNDVKKCCTEMLQCWLEVDTTASWNKLIEALEHISHNALAEKIKQDILKGLFIVILCMYA